MTDTEIEKFGRISLGLSGGGTRAAGFHLGALDYLDRVGLLDDVAVITSASGGSIVNSTYSMQVAKGMTFREYLPWILDKLASAEMVEWVLSEMSKNAPRNVSGRNSLVVALAEVYDRWFFEGFRYGDILDSKQGHLVESVLNATDFRTGLGFRFQRHDPVGNSRTHLVPEDLRHARLADMMAASSCLPGGMEPFYFPEDFVWETPEAKAACTTIQGKLKQVGVDAVPLMDGGVYDNQGLESLILAATRIKEQVPPDAEDPAFAEGIRLARSGDDSQKKLFEFDLLFQRVATGSLPAEPPGLVIISDVPQEGDPVYRSGYAAGSTAPDGAALPLGSLPQPPAKGPTIRRLEYWWMLLVALCAGSAIALGIDIYAFASKGDFDWLGRDFLLDVFPLILSVVAFGALWWVRKQVGGVMQAIDGILQIEGRPGKKKKRQTESWPFIRKLHLAQVLYLVQVRLSSVLSLTGDIFFIRTRILSYVMVYMMSGWRKKLLTNEIYDLDRNAQLDSPDAPVVTDAMRAIGQKAAAMPTAFWFERADDLPNLLAAGQLNMCANLLIYLRREKRTDPAGFNAGMAELLARIERDWQTLTGDPMALCPPIPKQTVKLRVGKKGATRLPAHITPA